MSCLSRAHLRSVRFALLLLGVLTGRAAAQKPDEVQAKALLADARRAYAEKSYPNATARFRDFLNRWPNHADAPVARLGLAVSLLDHYPPDADGAMAQLAKLLPEKAFADLPFAQYYAGVARRCQGDREADPDAARRRFDDAAGHFRDAAAGLSASAKSPADHDWALRARCDEAETLLRGGKAKEARETIAPALGEKTTKESRYFPLAHYHHGFACFLLGDHLAAGRSLARTAVLTDEVFGTHARYLLGRVHQLNTKQDEREEARLQYQAVLREHETAVKNAQSKIHQPGDAETKARRERLVRQAPDHVARARFFLAVLQYEDSRFADAQEHFRAFVTLHPKAGLAAEARLRLGLCQMHMKQPGEALRTLTQRPLTEFDPAQAAQVLHGIGRAQLAMADPKRPEMYRAAIEGLKKAAEHPRARRGEVMADLVEAFQQARLYKDAVAACAAVLKEKLLPGREEEMTAALAAMQQLAGDHAGSEKTCADFLARYKDSPFVPAVLFRHAENAVATGHNDEALKRYTALIDRHPDSPNAHQARQRLGAIYYAKGDLEKAQKAFEAVPAADRAGDLASVSYCLADVYLRQLPARADDAVSAGKAEEKLKSAAEALEAFLGAVPEGPLTPDAFLKLGYCLGRTARLRAQPAERQEALAAARQAYERIRDRYRGHGLYPQAMFERAKVLVDMRDINRGITELRVFTTDGTLRKSPVAPMALLHMATLQRRINRPQDAVNTLAACRKAHEESMQRDEGRAGWVATLRYHHAVALREAGKLDEATALFDQVAMLDRPEGWDAGVRAGQCRKDLAMKKIADGRKQSSTKLVAEGEAMLRQAIGALVAHREVLSKHKPKTDELQKSLSQAGGRALYESAWAWREVAELEIDAARRKILAERGKKGGEVERHEVPSQPAEARAKSAYAELCKRFPDLTINADARLELAELLAQRRENDEAIKVLQGALEGEREPSPELTDRIKLRLAACLLDRAGKKDAESALDQLQPVTATAKSVVFPEALYCEAECQLRLGKLDDAVKLLSRFRDHGPLQRIAGVSDRALLRLGWALGEKKQWDQSRQAYEQLVGRFGGSPLRFEARHGIGWALQSLGRFDEAVNSYNQAVGGPARLSAQSQFHVGECRMKQKRYKDAATAFLVVPAKYDDKGWSAKALLEAARALQEDKQRDQAVQLLKRVLRDHPGSEHAESARKHLKELGES